LHEGVERVGGGGASPGACPGPLLSFWAERLRWSRTVFPNCRRCRDLSPVKPPKAGQNSHSPGICPMNQSRFFLVTCLFVPVLFGACSAGKPKEDTGHSDDSDLATSSGGRRGGGDDL